MKKLLIISLMCFVALAMQAQSTIPKGYIDLGLPSGTLWKYSNEINENDEDGIFTYDEAVKRFGNKLPTKTQWEELKDYCEWTLRETEGGYKVTGLNGRFIILPASILRYCDGDRWYDATQAGYWSYTSKDSERAWYLFFNSSKEGVDYDLRCKSFAVRLVHN